MGRRWRLMGLAVLVAVAFGLLVAERSVAAAVNADQPSSEIAELRITSAIRAATGNEPNGVKVHAGVPVVASAGLSDGREVLVSSIIVGADIDDAYLLVAVGEPGSLVESRVVSGHLVEFDEVGNVLTVLDLGTTEATRGRAFPDGERSVGSLDGGSDSRVLGLRHSAAQGFPWIDCVIVAFDPTYTGSWILGVVTTACSDYMTIKLTGSVIQVWPFPAKERGKSTRTAWTTALTVHPGYSCVSSLSSNFITYGTGAYTRSGYTPLSLWDSSSTKNYACRF